MRGPHSHFSDGAGETSASFFSFSFLCVCVAVAHCSHSPPSLRQTSSSFYNQPNPHSPSPLRAHVDAVRATSNTTRGSNPLPLIIITTIVIPILIISTHLHQNHCKPISMAKARASPMKLLMHMLVMKVATIMMLMIRDLFMLTCARLQVRFSTRLHKRVPRGSTAVYFHPVKHRFLPQITQAKPLTALAAR